LLTRGRNFSTAGVQAGRRRWLHLPWVRAGRSHHEPALAAVAMSLHWPQSPWACAGCSRHDPPLVPLAASLRWPLQPRAHRHESVLATTG